MQTYLNKQRKKEKPDQLQIKKSNRGFKNNMRQALVGLQNLGKALLFPIAVLPFAAVLNRFGQLAIDLNPIVDGAKNAGWWVGFIMQTPGKIVFDNIALLFAIGTAFGLSKDQRGEVALIGAVLYIALTTFLMEGGLTELIYKNVIPLTTYEPIKDASGQITSWVENANSGLSQLFYVPIFQNISIHNDGVFTTQITSGKYILNIGVLGGIVAGVTSAKLYNRFSEIKLPQALSFFGGRRFVPMIVLLVSLPIAFLFAIFWPWIQYALVKFGQLISSGDSWSIPGAFMYAFLNRMCQPFGVHHILNTFLWFQLPIEGNAVTTGAGQIILGEDFFKNINELWVDGVVDGTLTPTAITYLTGITDSWATTVDWSAPHATESFNQYFVYNPNFIANAKDTIIPGVNGNYIVMGDINAFQKGLVSGNFQTGYFPLYWGGLTGAALAMIMAAPKAKRKELMTFFVGIGIVAALTGIDEPIFFTFTFVAPILWIYNALFTACFAAAAIAMHMHVGFGFSGGLIDYIISFTNGWGMSKWEGIVNGPIYGVTSNPLWLLALAAIMFPVYYFSFYFTIKKLDLQTPGREHEDKTTNAKLVKTINIKGDQKYETIADNLIAIIGKDNFISIGNCSTRLRLNVLDNSVGSTSDFRAAGASGNVKIGDTGLQIIIGTDVQHVADALERKVTLQQAKNINKNKQKIVKDKTKI